MRPLSFLTVLTEPNSAAFSSTASRNGKIALLCGIVMLKPESAHSAGSCAESTGTSSTSYAGERPESAKRRA